MAKDRRGTKKESYKAMSQINISILHKDVHVLDDLVEGGFFSSRSAIIREAVKEKLVKLSKENF